MNNEAFIEYLKTQKDYKNKILAANPDIVFFGGSRAIGLATEKSDYDIISFTSEDLPEDYKNFKIDNDKNLNVHCIQLNIGQRLQQLLFAPGIPNYMFSIIGGIENLLTYPIIYNTKRGQQFLDIFINYNKELLQIGIYNFIQDYHIYLKRVVELTDFPDYSPKIIYYLLLAADNLLEENHKELILKIRRQDQLADEDIKVIRESLQKLENFYLTFDPNTYDYINFALEGYLCTM